MRKRLPDGHNPRTSRRRLLRLALVTPACLLLSSCAMLPLPGATAKGRLVDGLYLKIAILAGIVFVGVIGTLVFELIAFRNRAGRAGETPPQNFGKPLTVGGFFAIGVILVAILYPSGELTLQRVDRVTPKPALDVMFVGSQWQWAAMYEKQGFTVTGETYRKPLVWELPVNRSVRIDLRATDVMHEFYVPSFLFMRNAVPGHPNVFSFTPDKLGTFHGQCAQLCGTGHYQMTFTLKVVPQAQFVKWVAEQKSEAHAAKCPPPQSHITLTARNVHWSTDCIGVPAGQAFTVTMKNEDPGTKHNFAIYNGPDLKKNFFKGPIFAGVSAKVLHVPALPAGTYYFQCDIHGKAMSGTIIAGKQSNESQEARGTRFKLTVKNVAWSVGTIAVPAGKPVTITMENEDAGTKHNFAVYDGPDLKKNFFKGPVFEGVATKVLHVPALPAGTYYFQCDIHGQSMSGQYIVGGG